MTDIRNRDITREEWQEMERRRIRRTRRTLVAILAVLVVVLLAATVALVSILQPVGQVANSTDQSGMTKGVSTQTPSSDFRSQRARLFSLLNMRRTARGEESDGMPMPMELTYRILQPRSLSCFIHCFSVSGL